MIWRGRRKEEAVAVAGAKGEGEAAKAGMLPAGDSMVGGGGETEKEGALLLGDPTFEQMGNGRLKCVETGHEMPAGEGDAYKRSKRCRLALIDVALSLKKPPLNLFKQDPLSRSLDPFIFPMPSSIISQNSDFFFFVELGYRHIIGFLVFHFF